MTIDCWSPEESISRQEQFILRRLKRNGKLYAFLRLQRHRLFDEAFQAELAGMYRDTGAGKDANPPALMAMVLLLQAYAGASDATAVELSLLDLRWQMDAVLLAQEGDDLKLAGVDPARHPEGQEPHSLGTHRGGMVARRVIHLGVRRTMASRGDASRSRWTTFGTRRAHAPEHPALPRWLLRLIHCASRLRAICEIWISSVPP